MVQAFAPHAADQAFHIRILPRAPWRRAARSAKISMILCMPESVSGGDAKFQGFCDGWNKWEGQAQRRAVERRGRTVVPAVPENAARRSQAALMTSSSQAWKRPKSPSAGARSLISHLQPGQKIVPAGLPLPGFVGQKMGYTKYPTNHCTGRHLTMSKVLKEVLAANKAYAGDFGKKGKLAMPPARRFAVLTCMDARLDPAKFAGLGEGDAHVIRNAGGRASDDAIRSLVISYKLLGTREWFVIHHTNCGMETFTDEIMRGLLASSLHTSSIGKKGWKDSGKGKGSTEGDYVDWLTFADNAKSVVADVKRIKSHPLVPKRIPVYGYIYDVKTGRLKEIKAATAAGKA